MIYVSFRKLIMCAISDNIKFCTCSGDDVIALNHYWILHRKVNGKNLMLIGEPIFEHYKQLPYFESNNTILCNRLNEKDAFDKPLQIKENDHFEIVFKNLEHNEERITHCFVYKNGKWKTTEFDAFNLMNKFDEINSGVFVNPFDRNIAKK
ncbi:MAG TPA: hypothetical protein PLC61_08485 [Chitinophagales bacterium]|nr:hypothetical protein [Chitinophagales bacterium]HND46411.1 hypothetical protein [Chitinophagales bacterium]HNE87578.1 hypothetical protein [Chitinophagales bacterium]HNJ01839.1 hypothetical protein [Chitinophagales bacterium]HNL57666.1 hypothetical protein [Chitinophagales bacterium]